MFARIGKLGLFSLFAGFAWADEPPQKEVNTPPAKNERYSDKLKVGDAAPDFTLADPKGKKETKLSSFQDKKPVVLIFGSYT